MMLLAAAGLSVGSAGGGAVVFVNELDCISTLPEQASEHLCALLLDHPRQPGRSRRASRFRSVFVLSSSAKSIDLNRSEGLCQSRVKA